MLLLCCDDTLHSERMARTFTKDRNIQRPSVTPSEFSPHLTGILTVRLQVSGSDGSVLGLEWLADTLVPLPAGPELPADQIRAGVQKLVQETLLGESGSGRAGFPPSKDGTDTFITLPIVFD